MSTEHDDDMDWGQLETVSPRRHPRPDRDRNCVVAPLGRPAATDLPIYVHLDVMRELERHACSDPDIELGGVLLGGQYEDDARNPFVIIMASLRAEHYENTRVSFKFTHDTWSDITRRWQAEAADTQMVGWYHTHPGWGVFLSGMDKFICEHFFNRPLDVALVIDPCRREQAFFVWSRSGAPQTRETEGFYLISSPDRAQELAEATAQWEAKRTTADESTCGPSDAG